MKQPEQYKPTYKQYGYGNDYQEKRRRGRPALSGNVWIEPIYVSEPDLVRLAQVLEQYARHVAVDGAATHPNSKRQ